MDDHRSAAASHPRAAHHIRSTDEVPPALLASQFLGVKRGRTRYVLTLAAALAGMLAWPLITSGVVQFLDSTFGYQLTQRGGGLQFSIWTYMPHMATLARPILAAALILLAISPMFRPAVQDARQQEKIMDRDVQNYIDAISREHRALFDRVHRIILRACPAAEVVFSNKMPTYQNGTRRLHMGVWKHGVSIYGWKASGDAGFTDRHPDLQTSTGTIRIRTDAAAQITDRELADLACAVLGDH